MQVRLFLIESTLTNNFFHHAYTITYVKVCKQYAEKKISYLWTKPTKAAKKCRGRGCWDGDQDDGLQGVIASKVSFVNAKWK